MFRHSLTAKILLALGVTVAAVIAIYTSFVIRTQSAWWHEHLLAQGHTCVTMVDEYLKGVMLSEHHEEVVHFLSQLKKSREIQTGRIVGRDGQIKFSTEPGEIHQAPWPVPAELYQADRMLPDTRVTAGGRVAVLLAPVRNDASCRRCHHSTAPHLGAIVLEKSLAPIEASIATNRNLLILYGLVIFALVSAVLWLLIVRLVSRPVDQLVGQMRRV